MSSSSPSAATIVAKNLCESQSVRFSDSYLAWLSYKRIHDAKIIFNYIRFFFHFYIKYMSLWSYWICLWLMNNHNHCYQSWCFWMCLCPTCVCFFFQLAKLIKQFPYQQEKWLILIGIFNFFFNFFEYHPFFSLIFCPLINKNDSSELHGWFNFPNQLKGEKVCVCESEEWGRCDEKMNKK